jgi:hypothetical protein
VTITVPDDVALKLKALSVASISDVVPLAGVVGDVNTLTYHLEKSPKDVRRGGGKEDGCVWDVGN